ncbi:MAG: hypothetical protein WCQ89_18900 [Verrucomicrobiota bacterium]
MRAVNGVMSPVSCTGHRGVGEGSFSKENAPLASRKASLVITNGSCV